MASPLLNDGSEPMASLLGDLARLAPSRLTILILGPTGSGKELVARELHQRSGRRGPLVPVNCSALAEGILDSELFGHVRGAFTGALNDRIGAIESAAGGTLFLDEVGDLSPRLQSLLLRVLQERELRRVGAAGVRQVDVRFLAATHRPLDTLAEAGQFRWDLLHRLRGAVLEVPGLAARRHEFSYLVPRLLAQLAEEAGAPGPALSPGLVEALASLAWPGNIRELRHALERARLRRPEGPLGPAQFPELTAASPAAETWTEATRSFQRQFLESALRRHGYRIAEVARALGLARPAVYAAARRLGLALDRPGRPR